MAEPINLDDFRPGAGEAEVGKPIKRSGGGGGGDMSDIDARVKRLEDQSKEVGGDLKAIRIDLAEVKGKLSAMPSTWQIITICAALIGIVIASGGGLLAIMRAITPAA